MGVWTPLHPVENYAGEKREWRDKKAHSLLFTTEVPVAHNDKQLKNIALWKQKYARLY